jgi:hypothetical protein
MKKMLKEKLCWFQRVLSTGSSSAWRLARPCNAQDNLFADLYCTTTPCIDGVTRRFLRPCDVKLVTCGSKRHVLNDIPALCLLASLIGCSVSRHFMQTAAL